MDAVALLLINSMWALVVLAAIATAGVLLRRFSFKDRLVQDVEELIGKGAELRLRVNQDEAEVKELTETVLKLRKDFDYVRGELQKLKAIPQTLPRY